MASRERVKAWEIRGECTVDMLGHPERSEISTVYLVLRKWGPMTIRQLSEEMGFFYSNVKVYLHRLKEEGFVDSKPDEEDRRVEIWFVV